MDNPLPPLIERLAREAGYEPGDDRPLEPLVLERFAALVAQHLAETLERSPALSVQRELFHESYGQFAAGIVRGAFPMPGLPGPHPLPQFGVNDLAPVNVLHPIAQGALLVPDGAGGWRAESADEVANRLAL